MYTLNEFAHMVSLSLDKSLDRYKQIHKIKQIINKTSQKSLSNDRDTIDEILNILYEKYNFRG